MARLDESNASGGGSVHSGGGKRRSARAGGAIEGHGRPMLDGRGRRTVGLFHDVEVVKDLI